MAYVKIAMSGEIDVGTLARGKRIVEGIELSIGGKSVFMPEYMISEAMDELLLNTFRQEIAAALAATAEAPHDPTH